MLNNLLEESRSQSRIDDPNPLAGSSYRNESDVDFNLKNDEFNYQNAFNQKDIDDFRLQLNNFEV